VCSIGACGVPPAPATQSPGPLLARSEAMTPTRIGRFAVALSLFWCIRAGASDTPPAQKEPTNSTQGHHAPNLKGPEEACPWGEPVDGIAARIVVQPRYVVGQTITAVMELKNVSKKKRYVIQTFDPSRTEYTVMSVSGPQGEIRQNSWGFGNGQLW